MYQMLLDLDAQYAPPRENAGDEKEYEKAPIV